MLVKSQVKYIQSLSQKKLREQENVFVAEGPKIINDLLAASNTKPIQLFALESWIKENPIIHEKLTSAQIFQIEQSQLERISFLSTPNQVLGIFEKPHFKKVDKADKSVKLLLDGIQDPGNLGTIIRCADWFGLNQIFASSDTVDAFNPKVVQSTMSSIARVQVIYGSSEEFVRNEDSPVFAATLSGKSILEIPKIKEGLIIIGNESRGINESVLSGNYQEISIPRRGAAESLNAAVATGIILSHLT